MAHVGSPPVVQAADQIATQQRSAQGAGSYLRSAVYDGVEFGCALVIRGTDAMVLNRSAPRATVVPILVYEDVTAAIEWLCSAFGFTERLRAGAPGVVSHAQLTVGDGAIMLGRQGAEFRPPRTGEVSQYVTVH